MKIILLFLTSLVIFSCAEEEVEDGTTANSSSEPEFTLTLDLISNKSNLSSINSLIENPSSNSSNNIVSGGNGYVQGVTTGDEVKPIFNNYIGGVLAVKKTNGKFLYKGDFNVTPLGGDSYQCLLIFENTSDSSCLIKDHELLESFSFNFYKDASSDVALILIGMTNTNQKILYEYDLSSQFFKIEEFNSGNDIIEQSGSVIDSFGSNDSISFLIEDGPDKYAVLVKKENSAYKMRKEVVTSPSLMDVSGDYYYMSNGNLRGGWDKSIYYKTSSNNRTISKSYNVVSFKDGFFPLFYQSDYIEHGYPLPSILYFRPKRDDLPASYPEFTFEQIKCCFTKNSPDGDHLEVGKIGWSKVLGFKKYALAYGESIGTNYNGYQDGDIIIQKALILIDPNRKTYIDGKNPFSSKIVLYDFNNTSSPEENRLSVLDLDVVTLIENYINGFKVTGTKNGTQKEVYYNPYTPAIETPNTNDQQSFIIKQRL